MNRRFLLSVFLLILMSVAVQALEISDGMIKVVFHDNTGRFTVYYMEDIASEKYLPLLFEKDPRTTVLNILVGNKVYTLGATGSFKQRLMRTDDGGAGFLWQSSAVLVREEISFIKSPGSSVTDGIKIEIKIENLSDAEQFVGIRYLFDTYLGEADKKHFNNDMTGEILSETDFTDVMPGYWVSPVEADKDSLDSDEFVESYASGLQVMTSGTGITRPDRVVFANWSRLNDTSWAYASRSNRNFNYLPYSINDSAVCHYYNPVKIDAGSIESFIIVMGNYNPYGFSLTRVNTAAVKPDDNDVSIVPETKIASMTVEELEQYVEEDTELSMENDLKVVTDILARIDELISSGEYLSKEQLEKIQHLINNLKERKKQY